MKKDLADELKKLVERKKIPAAILLHGSQHQKLISELHAFANTLLCDNNVFGGCAECQPCKLFASGNNPDFISLNLEADSKVETIREILRSCSLKPYCSKSRVVIFERADHLSISSANILLKSLEEPNKDLYFLLTALQPSRIPATILSRCQKYYVEDIQEENIHQQKTGELNFLGAAELPLLLNDSADSVDLIAAEKDKWLYFRQELQTIASGSRDRAVLFSRELSQDKEKVSENIVFLRLIARLEMFKAAQSGIQSNWSIFLMNMLAIDSLVNDRNLNFSLLILSALTALAESSFPANCNNDNLLEFQVC